MASRLAPVFFIALACSLAWPGEEDSLELIDQGGADVVIFDMIAAEPTGN